MQLSLIYSHNEMLRVLHDGGDGIPELASQVYGPISPSFTVHMSLTTSV